MQMLNPDDVDLSEYVKVPDLAAKVLPASLLAERVKQSFDPRQDDRSPAMLTPKARGLQFRPGEVTCWAGYNGHRKSMFTSQVALDLAHQGRRLLIVSLEMTPMQTLKRMVRQATALPIPPGWQIDRFHKWTDGRLWLFDHVGRLDAEHCIALCRYFAETHQGTDVLIDSMMRVCESEEHLDDQKRFIGQLCDLVTQTGLHAHLVVHCRKPASGDESKPPTKYDIKGSGAISDQAHNVVMLWWNKAKQAAVESERLDTATLAKPDFLMVCEKQRNGAWEGALKFWFDAASMRFVGSSSDSVQPYALGGAA